MIDIVRISERDVKQGELVGGAGLARIRAQGDFTHAGIVEEAIKEYKQEANPARIFLEERYEEAPNERVPCGDVYQSYRE